VVKMRRGAIKLGCLFSLLIAVTIAYFGVNVGEVFWRYYQFEDAMAQEARFARTRTDDEIRKHLSSLADSLGLPEEAGRISVRRTGQGISIWSVYAEHVELPLLVRVFRFSPRADAGL